MTLLNLDPPKEKPLAVLICTPCYGGLVSADYMRAVMAWNELARQNNITSALFTISSSLIASARNDCVAVFRQNEMFTDLLFCDADIVFDPHAVLAFVKHPAPVLAGVCALKQIEWEEVRQAALNGASADQLPFFGVRTNIGANTKDSRVNFKPEADGTFKIDRIGTGFMRIKRQVFEDLEIYNEERVTRLGQREFLERYKVAPGRDGVDERTQFFQTEVKDGMFTGEDLFFCDLLNEAGIELRAHSKFRFGHIGPHLFVAGNLGVER